MIHRCETCPFWKQAIQTDSQNRQTLMGICRKAAFRETETTEGSILFWAHGLSKDVSDADLVTHKDFGCIAHPMNKAIS